MFKDSVTSVEEKHKSLNCRTSIPNGGPVGQILSQTPRKI